MTNQGTTKKRRLGKGLQSMLKAAPVVVDLESTPKPINNLEAIPDAISQEKVETGATPGNTLLHIDVARISPSPFQPRREFEESELNTLAESIRESGLLQPIVVRPGKTPGDYELIAGERRWRASQIVGLTTLPAIVQDVDDETAAGLALIENLQRSDLNPIERADALKALQQRFGLTQQQIAERVKLERSTVANLIRLAELDPELRGMVASGKLSAGHARALLSHPAGQTRTELAIRCVNERWTVRDIERYTQSKQPAQGPANSHPNSRGTAEQNAELADLQKRLSQHMETKVSIKTNSKGEKGELVIAFYSIEDFDNLLGKLGFAPEIM